MYDAGGWLAKGPAGMEYIPVMVAEHEIPLIVGAYQMGIRGYDAEKAVEAVSKMQTTPPERVAGWLAGTAFWLTFWNILSFPFEKGVFTISLNTVCMFGDFF